MVPGRSPARCGRPSRRWHVTPWSSPVPVAPTAASTPGGRWCRCDLSQEVDLEAPAPVADQALRSGDRGPRGGRGAPGFDARFSARSRTYRYTVLNSPFPSPFHAAHGLARTRAPRHRAAHPGVRPVPGRARLQRLLPPPQDLQGGGATFAGPTGPTSRLDRPRRRRCCASRSRLPPSATRWCAASWAPSSPPVTPGFGPGTSAASSDPATDPRPPPRPPQGLCLWHVAYD